jgi:hypothetical protein
LRTHASATVRSSEIARTPPWPAARQRRALPVSWASPVVDSADILGRVQGG